MKKDQLLKSVARVALAGLGMGIVAAADEAANHNHNNQQKKKNIVGWAILGSICQGVMEIYYNSTKKEQ